MRRVAVISLGLCSCLTLACADDVGLDGGDETSSTGSGDGDGDPSTGDGDPSTGDGDPATGDGDPSTGDGDPSTGDGDPSTGDGDGDPTTGDGDGDPTTGDGDGDPDQVLRFVAIGDAGEGNEGQYNVAAAIEQICAAKGGCEFVLVAGDNFYDDGVASVDDDQFQTKFELPYADLDLPFWMAMGNHDYGVLSFEWQKLAYEVEYTNYSDKWTMLDKWYVIEQYPMVDFFVLDTTRLMWNHETSAQQTWFDQALAASDKPWKIAFGHHPYYSNGAHGNAGNYEGLPWPPQAAGTDVKEFMDESLCGNVDLYLAGHDHNRQWHMKTCSGGDRVTSFIVTGAGCKTTDFESHGDNEVYWEDDTKPGFLLLELTADNLHTEFYDQSAILEYQRDIPK